jgi:hypothetical protein
MSKRELSIARKIQRVTEALALGKKHYARVDELMGKLPAEAKSGKWMRLDTGGRVAKVVDQTAELAAKGVLWKPCGFRRWDLIVKEM